MLALVASSWVIAAHATDIDAPTTRPADDAGDVAPISYVPLALPSAPSDPHALGAAPQPRVVVLTAPWCQWCRVLETRSLPHPLVRRALERELIVLEIDVDEAPLWMDLPGVAGLPSLAFFAPDGTHVLTKSGYRDPDELSEMVTEIARRISRGELAPYGEASAPVKLPMDALTPPRARALLSTMETTLFIGVNSNEGGWRSPARDPAPELLVELQAWSAHGAPPRVRTWVDTTVAHALIGSSPRMARAPLLDLMFGLDELRALAAADPPYPARWYEGVETLATTDPYRGLMDPVDGGVFRYASTTGWYDPHFERRARDNIAWVLLLRARGDRSIAPRIERYVRTTFFTPTTTWTSQASDPFYFRLRADERRGVRPPRVAHSSLVDVNALSARLEPARCAILDGVERAPWPQLAWPPAPGTLAHEAPPDAVGNLLSSLATACGEPGRRAARTIAVAVVERWARVGLPRTPRLATLARGVCDALPSSCLRALAALEDVPIDPAFPPPLVHLARIARR